MKKIFLIYLLFFFTIQAFPEKTSLKFNPWELIIYRPENSEDLNQIRCFLKIQDENGNDITKSEKVKICYEWVSIPGKAYYFKNKIYLSGGMAIHLNLKPGKYNFSVYTPKEEQFYSTIPNKNQWESNIFSYSTENPLKVIFVYPEANENGFYTETWKIDYKAPKFWKFTKPSQKN